MFGHVLLVYFVFVTGKRQNICIVTREKLYIWNKIDEDYIVYLMCEQQFDSFNLKNTRSFFITDYKH